MKCLVFTHNKPQVTHNVAFQSHVKNNTTHTLSVYELTSVLEASSRRIGRLPAEGFREASVRLFDEDWGSLEALVFVVNLGNVHFRRLLIINVGPTRHPYYE